MTHISVAIPVYNREDLIGETIDCVVRQSHRDVDLTVVDDGSSDRTVDVVKGFLSDPRVRLEQNPANLGLARNWNRCLALAKGPLVIVLGSDDLLDPDYLGHVAEEFHRRPDLGLAHAPVRSIDGTGRYLGEERARPARVYDAGDEAVVALLSSGICTVTSVFRKECVERLGGFNEAIWTGPDIEFVLRIAASYAVYDGGRIYGSYRRHADNAGPAFFLRDGLIETILLGLRETWTHVSPEARRRLGVRDLDDHLRWQAASYALNAALGVLARGRADLSRDYLRKARGLHPRTWWQRRFWQALLLSGVPPLGHALMARRLRRFMKRARAQ